MEGFENFMRGFVPISVSEVGKGDGYGMVKTAVGATGLKSSPMTPNERRDEDVRKAELVISADGEPIKKATSYYELTGTQQKAWDASNGKIKPSDTPYNTAKDDIGEIRLGKETGLYDKASGFVNSQGEIKDPEGFRKRAAEIQKEAAIASNQAAKDLADFKGDKPSDPNPKALWEYRDSFISSNDPTGSLDFDAQQKKLSDYEKTWTPDQKKAVEEIRRAEHVPGVQKLYDDKKELRDSGYFEIYDNAWGRLQKAYPNSAITKYGSLTAWWDANEPIATKWFIDKGATPAQARVYADAELRKNNVYKEFQNVKDAVREDWIVKNRTGAARMAVKWEYITAKELVDYIERK